MDLYMEGYIQRRFLWENNLFAKIPIIVINLKGRLCQQFYNVQIMIVLGQWQFFVKILTP